jgi:hypothetical protein
VNALSRQIVAMVEQVNDIASKHLIYRHRHGKKEDEESQKQLLI